MPRVGSNYQMFANRGDAWDAPEIPRRPVSPTGELRLPLSARAYLLTKGKRPPLGKPLSLTEAPTAVAIPHGEHCMPIAQRLAKERNHVLPPEPVQERKPVSLATQARAAMLARRAARKVKC
jgi:hypothetical protein